MARRGACRHHILLLHVDARWFCTAHAPWHNRTGFAGLPFIVFVLVEQRAFVTST
jgi:hypothetical protein